MARKTDTDTKKTYILNLINGGTRKVQVPSTWKLSFGQLVPYVKGPERPRYEGNNTVALRFYEGNKDNLRAVFTDVTSFHEVGDLTILEKRTAVKEQVIHKGNGRGQKNYHAEVRMTEWVDPTADPDTSKAEADDGFPALSWAEKD